MAHSRRTHLKFGWPRGACYSSCCAPETAAESSPIPPEGLDREDDYDDSIDHSAIDYFADNNIPHDQFGNPLDDSLEAPEEFTGSFNDQDSEDFADYDKEMQRLRRK